MPSGRCPSRTAYLSGSPSGQGQAAGLRFRAQLEPRRQAHRLHVHRGHGTSGQYGKSRRTPAPNARSSRSAATSTPRRCPGRQAAVWQHWPSPSASNAQLWVSTPTASSSAAHPRRFAGRPRRVVAGRPSDRVPVQPGREMAALGDLGRRGYGAAAHDRRLKQHVSELGLSARGQVDGKTRRAAPTVGDLGAATAVSRQQVSPTSACQRASSGAPRREIGREALPMHRHLLAILRERPETDTTFTVDSRPSEDRPELDRRRNCLVPSPEAANAGNCVAALLCVASSIASASPRGSSSRASPSASWVQRRPSATRRSSALAAARASRKRGGAPVGRLRRRPARGARRRGRTRAWTRIAPEPSARSTWRATRPTTARGSLGGAVCRARRAPLGAGAPDGSPETPRHPSPLVHRLDRPSLAVSGSGALVAGASS